MFCSGGAFLTAVLGVGRGGYIARPSTHYLIGQNQTNKGEKVRISVIFYSVKFGGNLGV